MKKKHLIQFVVLILLFLPTQGLPQNLLASTSMWDIVKINPNICSESLICHNSMAFGDIATEGGVLYGVGNYNIYSIDTITGIETQLAYSPYGFSGLVGDGDGHLYAAGDSMISEYDIASGVFSNLGTNGYICIGDLAFNNGELYELGTINYNSVYLVHINLNPFYSTSVGTLNFCSSSTYGLVDIGSVEKNSLYASAVYTTSVNSNYLYKINVIDASVTLICTGIGNDVILGLTNVSNTITSIPEISVNNNITVYPNPAIDQLTIESIQKSTIEILNIHGQTILQRQIQQGKTNIDISILAKGIYILRLTSNDKTAVTKIVKE